MKRAPILNLALAVLVAGSITACKQGPATPATTAPPAASTNAKNEIVFINSDSLSKNYTYVKDMDKRLTTKSDAAKSDLQSKGEAFQREVAEYQKSASTMPADQRQTTEQRLQREQQQLQSYQQNASAEVQNEQSVEMGKLYDKISDFVKSYAKEKGYKMVLTYSKNNTSMLYGDASLDVTADVVKRLNDAYAKETPSK
jgi:outer membrane protein